MPASKSSAALRRSNGVVAALVCFALSSLTMAAAVWWFHQTGATLLSGDAEAHLNISRRIIDSRTPGWNQIGTTWLPLPHLLTVPFVRYDSLWTTGLAGAIPAALCMALAATFLFSAMSRIFASTAAGAAAAAVFLLNPNTLYLGAIPMTEPALFASVFALLYFTVRFADTQGWGAVFGAGIAASAGALTRYEAWFLLPFVALFFLFSGGSRRWVAFFLFCGIAAIGPLVWLAHNWWYFGDPLYFYRGPWSAKAIQGNKPYPGRGNWREAADYYLAAGVLLTKWPAIALAAAGSLVALLTRSARWPLLFLLLPPLFYVWSMHSSGTPIFVPHLYPHGYYNIRYGMAVLGLVALGAAAVGRYGKWPALAVVLLSLVPFALDWNTHPITWQEAEMNSRGRRAWIAQATNYLRRASGPRDTFFTSFNDMTAIYRTLGIHLRDTLTSDNYLQFIMAESRPDLLLWEDWAVVMGGDPVQSIVDRARLHGPDYELVRQIAVKNQPVIEIYRRKEPLPVYENSVR
jgi:hypothetical protein